MTPPYLPHLKFARQLAFGFSSSTFAALAILQTHIPPPFEGASRIPLTYPYAEQAFPSKLSRRPAFTTTQLLSFLVLLTILTIQFLRPHPFEFDRPVFRPPSASQSVQQAVCENTDLFTYDLPISRPHKMALLQEVENVAKEFEFSTEQVRNAVREFQREMGL